MAREDDVHALGHHLLLVQETAGRVGDRHEVVTDLEDDDALHPQRDALVGDAVHGQLCLVEVQGQFPYRLHAREYERPPPGDDPEPHALPEALGLVGGAGDDECLVRFGHPPHELEQADQSHDCGENDSRHDADSHRQRPLSAVPFGTDGAESAPAAAPPEDAGRVLSPS